MAGNRQPGIDRAGGGIIYRNQSVVRIEMRPAADRAVQRVKQKRRSPAVDLEFRRAVVHDARRRTKALARSGRNRHHQALLRAGAGIESRQARSLIAQPERFAGSIRKSPRIEELFVAFLAGTFHQRGRCIELAALGQSHARGNGQRQDQQRRFHEILTKSSTHNYSP